MRRLALAAAMAALPAMAADRSVAMAGIADDIDPRVLDDFTAATGIAVFYDGFDTQALVEARVQTGKSGYDLAILSGPAVQRQAALLQKLDKAKLPGLAGLSFASGFPHADFHDCGPSVFAYAESQSIADAATDRLAAEVRRRESAFLPEFYTAPEAVRRALDIARTASKPVVIADTQDNPGGGGHGDTTGLLAELIAQRAEGAVLALINDAEAASAFHAAGQGATVHVALGGKSDGVPLNVAAEVLLLTNGEFVNTGPMGKGNPADLGPCALIRVGGVRVIVVSRKTQAYDQALFRHVGIEPADCRILVLKSSVHFRADFQPIAEAVLVAAAPGPVVADPAILPFQHVRPSVRRRPLDNR